MKAAIKVVKPNLKGGKGSGCFKGAGAAAYGKGGGMKGGGAFAASGGDAWSGGGDAWSGYEDWAGWGEASGAAAWGSAKAMPSIDATDMFGAGGAMYGYGPWANWDKTKEPVGPYFPTRKEVKAKEDEEKQAAWDAKHAGPTPVVEWLKIAPTSEAVKQGYPALMPAIEFNKNKDAFSDAHQILGDFFVVGGTEGKPEYIDQADVCEFVHDWNGGQFPEIHAAWKEAGNDENCLVVGTYPQGGIWAAGFGGKDKATKAVKLALAVAIAQSDAAAAMRVASMNQPFAALWAKACETHPDSQPEGGSSAGAGVGAIPAARPAGPRDTTPVIVQLKGFPDWTESDDLRCVLQHGGYNFAGFSIIQGPNALMAEMTISGWEDARAFVEQLDKFEFTPGYPLRARIKPGQLDHTTGTMM